MATARARLLLAVPCAVVIAAVAEAVPPPDREETANLPGSPGPEPAPAPADAAVPERAAEPLPPLRFRPPFSLDDCRALLQQGTRALPGTPQEPESVERNSLIRLIESVRVYLTTRDDLNSSLAHYRWDQIERGRVSKGPLDSDEFHFDEPQEIPRRITALSFEVEREDALLHYLAVYDTDGQLVADFEGLKSSPAALRHSLPRREVFHLWRPTDIGRIELSYSQANPTSPTDPIVHIHGGRSSRPEHGKSAVFFLTRAEQRLRAGRFPEARQDISDAETHIGLWARQRQSR